MSGPKKKAPPQSQPAASGGPPKPPKKTARGLEDQPIGPDERNELVRHLLEEALRKGK
jgi:hypothetical protein